MEKLIISCAITGAETRKDQNPALPITPEEQAQTAYDCWKAGASVIHLHVRDNDGNPTQSVDRFQEAITLIQKRCPVIVQISTGGAVGEDIENRAAPLELKPEMASLNVGSINFGEEVFTNLSRDVNFLARKMKDLNIRPEIEVYDYGMLEYGLKLMERGVLPNPSHFQFVMGTSHGITGEPKNLMHMASLLPEGCTWTAAGIGRFQLSVTAMAIVMGGHVRVGLEDNIYWSKGVLAQSNAQFVERVVLLSRLLQRPVATPEEARAILKVRKEV